METIDYAIQLLTKQQWIMINDEKCLKSLSEVKTKLIALKKFRELLFLPSRFEEADARGYIILLNDIGLMYSFDDDVFDIKWEIEYTPTEGELEFMNDRQKEINALESFCPFEFNSELNSLYMKGLEKYGSWYYLLSDGVLLQKPMSQGDTLDDAPFYDSNDDELVVVCSTAFNDEERKEFDNDMKQLFGDSYNGLSAQSVG